MERIFVGHDCQAPAARPGALAQVEEGDRRVVRVRILGVDRTVGRAAQLAGRACLVEPSTRLQLQAQRRRARVAGAHGATSSGRALAGCHERRLALDLLLATLLSNRRLLAGLLEVGLAPAGTCCHSWLLCCLAVSTCLLSASATLPAKLGRLNLGRPLVVHFHTAGTPTRARSRPETQSTF